MISSIIGYDRLLKRSEKINKKYADNEGDNVFSNWPLYGLEKETQSRSDIEDYIDASFEGRKIMIFKNYNKILKTTFGDYMVVPPKEQRKNHSLIAYWKDDEK